MSTPTPSAAETAAFLAKFESARHLDTAVNTPAQIEEHVAITKGVKRFRFPPEPNGYLHVGHAKSCHINFGGALRVGGTCYLRYDDTNPEAESQEFIDSIAEMVGWLGWKPDAVTYSSDYFEQLYDFAVVLIKNRHAFIETSTKDEIQKQRDAGVPSPCRDRPVEESLRIFDEMRAGQHEQGSVCLRLRVDEDGYKHTNPNMRDPIAYRIKYHPHPRSGDKWCVYPTYDYTHCIVDSLEHIDYSICTLEFETRRESYFWLLDVLGLWKPHVFEFSRLNIEDAVLSKRKINALVRAGLLRGWDDARLLTLAGMRRRGYTPAAINDLVGSLGVSRASVTVIPTKTVEWHLRHDLDTNAPRAFGLLAPLKVTLTNVCDQGGAVLGEYTAPNHPTRPELGTRSMKLYEVRYYGTPLEDCPPCGMRLSTLYIDRADFKLEDVPGYWGLAPGKTVGLKYGPNITCTKAVTAENGDVVGIEATVDFAKSVKPKVHIQWLSHARGDVPPLVEVRSYGRMFSSEDAATSDDYLAAFNKASETVREGVMVEPHVRAAAPLTSFQFERVGFFVVDRDTSGARFVMNEVVALKDLDWEAKDADAARRAADAAARESAKVAREAAKAAKAAKDAEKAALKAAKKAAADGAAPADAATAAAPVEAVPAAPTAADAAPAAKPAKAPKAAKPAAEPAAVEDSMSQVLFTVGRIITAEPHPEAEQLWHLAVDLGEETTRSVCAGLRAHLSAEELVGRSVVVASNLAPRKLRGVESAGMIMCACRPKGEAEEVLPIAPPTGAAPGVRVTAEGHTYVGDAPPVLAKKLAKHFDAVAPGLATDTNGFATWEGKALIVDGVGPVTGLPLAIVR